jgi:uncharacterized RDD family membrane protein YckC
MRYYYADQNRQPVGPVGAEEVLSLYRTGKLSGASPLIAEGESAWGTIDTLLRPSHFGPSAYAPPVIAGCRACGAPLAAGARWCGLCHTSTMPGVNGTLASPARRLAAHMLDVAIPIGIALIVGVAVAATNAATGSPNMGGAFVGLLFVAYLIWALVLFSRGTTPGKNMLGMDVIHESGRTAGFGRMLVREWIGKLISGMVFGLGYIWILIDPDRQGWHDKLVSTYVVKRPDGA